MKKLFVGTMLVGASAAGFGFTLLNPGTSVNLPNDGPDFPTTLGPLLNSQSSSVTGVDAGSGVVFTGTLWSFVNQYDSAGHLAFGFYFQNDFNSLDSVERVTVSNFAGWTTWVANGDNTFTAPFVPHASFATRSANGKTIGFNWNDGSGDGPIDPGEEGRMGWIFTDAKYYTYGNASVINSGVGTASTFAPTTPEPASIAAIGLGLAGLIRRRKKA